MSARGVERAPHVAQLVVRALAAGAGDRPTLLATLKRLGDVDTHDAPPKPSVWVWHAGTALNLRPDHPL